MLSFSRGISVVFVTIIFASSCGRHSDTSNLAGDRHSYRKPSPSGNQNQPRQLDGRFPSSPDHTMTPGSLCDQPSEYRYPEHIKYCERDVDPALKAEIFIEYDQKLGFQTTQMERNDFKIDHLIPLCMGGSNKQSNLWPQYKLIYEHTDPVEPYLCGVLASGKIKQAEAVELILKIKESPYTAEEELQKLESRF